MDAEALLDQERVRRKTLADALADSERTLSPGVRQDEGEFVAAKARHDVGFSRAPADNGRSFNEGPAAILMPVVVVDALETVKIDEEQRQRPAATRGTLGFLMQHKIQIARVVQVRQIVGH